MAAHGHGGGGHGHGGDHGHGGGDHGHGGGHGGGDHGGGHGGGGGGGNAKSGSELISLITFLFFFLMVVPAIWRKITHSSGAREIPEQTFRILCKDAEGRITKTTEESTPWKGNVCDYFQIIPDSGQVILVTLPGYYTGTNTWHPDTTFVLKGGRRNPDLSPRGRGPLRIRKP